MAIVQHHFLFVVAALLIVAGIVLTTWREPAAREAIDGQSVETTGRAQPYFWPGAAGLVAGIVVGTWALRKSRRG